MITREFLESIQDLESVLKMKRRELAHLRETLDLKGVSYENIGAAPGTRKTDAIGEMVGKVVDFESELKADECKLANMVINATTAISKLESEAQREIRTRWYLRSERLKDIMAETAYSRSRIYALKKEGLENLPDFESQDETGQNRTDMD